MPTIYLYPLVNVSEAKIGHLLLSRSFLSLIKYLYKQTTFYYTPVIEE